MVIININVASAPKLVRSFSYTLFHLAHSSTSVPILYYLASLITFNLVQDQAIHSGINFAFCVWISSIKLDSIVSSILKPNEGKSAASFCHQVSAWFPDIFCNLYFVKNHKIANKLVTTKAREKISTDLESLNLDVRLLKFIYNQILLNKIGHRFLLTTKLFTGWKSLIRLMGTSPTKAYALAYSLIYFLGRTL